MPSRYRERLRDCCAEQLIVTIDPDRCLLIYPAPVWEEVENKLMQLSTINKHARGLQRLMVGHATECNMDAQGRILLPTLLREFANLDKQVVLVGQGKKFEIWDEQTWYRRREEWLEEEKQQTALPDFLESLSF